ncbi:MAG TPA: site-specific integrase [Bryobacteraceae bacterium]|jgi:integrase|nr:site-specific integrase [Bryobacteraceae bacterium]
MFSNWFSGDDLEHYRRSPHKQRIDAIASSLLRLKYASEVIRQHLHECLRFSRTLDAKATALPAPNAEAVRQYVAERVAGCSASRSRVLRASVRIFLEADEQGRFRRRVSCPPLTPPWFGPILTLYLEFVRRHRGLTQKTARKYIQKLSAFAQYLEDVGVAQLSCITPGHVREFYENPGHAGPRRSYGSTLRVFFRWAAVQGWVADSLGDAVPRPRQYRHVSLPEVLSAAEVERILAAVDQSTALGRRDYAILLLAARYGLRPCDIRLLALDDIDWRAGRIDLRQLKTGRPLALPLLPDVAQALSAYVRDGRPASSDRTIFLRHCAPFEPFAPENNLTANMRGALQRAGLGGRTGRRGLYLFRHTLATRLLAGGCPLKTIADVLGHASTDTTYGYTRVDLAGLRTVAISEEEVSR